MAAQVNKVSVVLNGGVDESSASELAAPVAQQGASLTLRASRNTRLSVKNGTCVRAPSAALAGGDATREIHSVISADANKTSLLLTRPGLNLRLGADGTTTGVGSGPVTTGGAAVADAILTARIPQSGTTPNQPSVSRINSALVRLASGGYHIYHVYSLPTTFGAATSDVWAYATDTNGATVVAPMFIVTSTIPEGHLSVSSHADGTANVWYDAAGTLTTLTIQAQVTANTFTVSAPVAPGVAGLVFNGFFHVVSGSEVDAAGVMNTTNRRYAYIITSTAILATLRRIDTQAGYAIVAAAGVAITFPTPSTAGVTVFTSAGITYVLLGISESAAGLTVRSYGVALTLNYTTTLADFPVGSISNLAIQGYSGVDSAGRAVVLASTNGALGEYITRVYDTPVGSAGLTPRADIPWSVGVNTGGLVRFSTTEAYPVFELTTFYGDTDGRSILGLDYVPDPSIQMWAYRNTKVAPIARYGTVRGAASPAISPAGAPFSGRTGALFYGLAEVWTSYMKNDQGLYDDHHTSRWLKVSLAPNALPRANDRDGTALVAAALPLEWDGNLPSELGGPLVMPHVTATPVVGGGFGPAGSYLVAAVYSWTDAAGKKHRSAPYTRAFTLVGANDHATIDVTAPASPLRGVETATLVCELYLSTPTDTTMRRFYPAAGTLTATNAKWTFTGVDGTNSFFGEQIYSAGAAGEEQTPQAPPPLRDIAIIADRAWGIDAEMPSRIVHSKRRVSGIGYEWHPGYELLLPSGAGAAVAIREWQGGVVVFAERAIFAISGDGPDNLVGNPSGGSFSKPQKLTDIGTTNGISVISSPAGILFQRDQDIMLFAGGPPKVLVGATASTTCVGAVVLRDYDEVVMFFPNRQLVWNYVTGRWTTWRLLAADNVTALTAREVSSWSYDQTRVHIVNDASPDTLYSLNSAQVSALPMSWETDWLVLGGDFQDHVLLQSVVFSARRLGPHGVRIDICTNYNDLPSTTRSYSAAELLALSDSARYTVKVQPQDRGTRAVKLLVTETGPVSELDPIGTAADGLGMEPIALTLYYIVEAMLHEQSIRPGAFK